MKSSIKVDFTDNGKGLEPIIKVSIEETDDPRDNLIKTFFQKLGGNSSWLRVEYLTNNRIIIYPLTPNELEETVKEMQSRISFTS